MSDFVTRNKPDWDELEDLVRLARKSIRKLTPEDLGRLDVLYRRTTIHLSQVAARTNDLGLVRYLNDLTAAAHSLIYVSPRDPMLRGAVVFLFVGFGRSIARTWRYQLASLLLTLGGAVVAYFAVMNDPVAAYALMPPGDIRTPGSTSEQLREVLQSGRDMGQGVKFAFASFLFSHNLKVGILAMGVGVLAAVPTVVLLVYNGMVLGTFAAIHNRAGIDAEMWAWILPHGITEIGSIILFGGVGLMLGHAVISPGLYSRAESLKRAGLEAARIFLGGAVMLVFAAVIESYLRQSHLDTFTRLGFAAATVVFWCAYIVNGFVRERRADQQTR